MADSKQLCYDCQDLKSRMVGEVSTVYWCGLVGDGRKGTSIGINPWIRKQHPKCPLRKKRQKGGCQS